MIGFHVTTKKKLDKYKQTGCILPPVRFWPNEFTAREWMKKTLRDVLLVINVEKSYPLPDHKPARWTEEIVRKWEIV
jgi:hypothetical protein